MGCTSSTAMIDEPDDNFDFEQLPLLLQSSIFEKFTFEDAAKFDQISPLSHNLYESSQSILLPFTGYEFLYSRGTLAISQDVMHKEKMTRRILLKDLPENVIFNVERIIIELTSELTDELVTFILTRTRGFELFNVHEHRNFGPLFEKLYEGLKPNEVLIDYPVNQASLPLDYHYSTSVTFVADFEMKVVEMFQVKVKGYAKFQAVIVTHGDLLEQLDMWKKGALDIDHMIVFVQLLGFRLPGFLAGMRTLATGHEETENGHMWRIVREDQIVLGIAYQKFEGESIRMKLHIVPSNWSPM